MADNFNPSREEKILRSIIDGTEYTGPHPSRIEKLLLELGESLSGKADLVDGLIPTSELPPQVFEHARVVEDDEERFALTTDDVQNGDLVYVNDTEIMYFVQDDTELDNENGYLPLAAGVAAKAIGDEDGNNIKQTYQTKISSTNKVSADNVDDSQSTNKFAKPDGVTIVSDADGTLHAIAVDIDSWEGVRTIVRMGLASSVFRVGDQLTCTRGNDEIIWDIVNITNDSITLLMHETLPDMVYDAKEAIFAFPDGLAAGEYHFTVTNQPWYAADVGKTISFTLTKAIPEGGQLVLGNAYNATMIGANITSYASGASTTSVESAVMAEGSGGTDLGSLTSAGTPASNINSIQKALLGSNTWKESAQRQWLNSDKAAGSVWTPQTPYDRPPTWASNTAGFLNGMEEEFLSVVAQTTYVTCRNTVSDGGGSDTCTDKFFLPSRKEIFGTDEVSGVSEGTQYQYYVGSTDADRIKYRAGSARAWRLRTPSAPSAYTVRLVTSTGALYYYVYTASTALGLSAACIVK